MTADLQHQSLALDARLVTEFVYALNIARRQVVAYPAGHQMIKSATAKLAEASARLLESRAEAKLGIARDTLLMDGEVLDAANPVFRDLAKHLFNAQIAVLTITRELTQEDVCRFFELFKQSPEQLAAQGGVAKLVADSSFKGLRVKSIDFSAFTATEVDAVNAPKTKLLRGNATVLWKSFANAMTKGTIDPDGASHVLQDHVDPVLLAEILNQSLGDGGAGEVLEQRYDEAITVFLRQMDREAVLSRDGQEPLGHLGHLVGALRPELRLRVLNSTLKSCAQRPEIAEAVLSHMPKAEVLAALEQIDATDIAVPQTLMDIFGKLSQNLGDGVPRSLVAGEAKRTVGEAAEQIAKLFSEDRSEYFVPRDYQDALGLIATSQINHGIDLHCADVLRAELDSHKVEKQFSAVLLDMLDHGMERPAGDAIGCNLQALVDYFLETGDFAALSAIYLKLHGMAATLSRDAFTVAWQTYAYFSDGEFVGRVLKGFDTWGKAAYESIQSLIEQIGSPFAEPLLDLLADEPSMSRRRVLMACLVRIGPQVKAPVAARLNDSRWYFVRNLVVVLRDIDDPAVVPLLGRLSGHVHPKVQFEVMKTYLHYGDERADSFLLRELAGKNPVSLLSAIQLAANSSDPRVVIMLSKLLNRRLDAAHEVTIKVNVIKALLDSATEDVLPELESFMLKKNWLGGSKLEPLKVSAVAILEAIGTIDAGILAGRVAQSATGELAKVAEDVLVRIHGKLT